MAALNSLGDDFGSVLPKGRDDGNGPDFAAQLGAALMTDSASPAPGAKTAGDTAAASVAGKARTRLSTASDQRTPPYAPAEIASLAVSVSAPVPSVTSDAAPSAKGPNSSAPTATRSSSASRSTASSIPLIEAYASAPTPSNFAREASGSRANSDSQRDANPTNPQTESRAADATHSVVNPTSSEHSSPAPSAEVTQDAAVKVTITRDASPISPSPNFAQVEADEAHVTSDSSISDIGNAKRESDTPAVQRSSTELISASTQKISTSGSPAVQRGTSAANDDRPTPVGRKTLTTGDGTNTLTSSDSAQQPNTQVANVFKSVAKAGTTDSTQAPDAQQAQSEQAEAAALVAQPAEGNDTNRDKIDVAPKPSSTPQGNSVQSPIADAQPQQVAPAAPVTYVHDSAPQPAQHTAKLTVELDGGGAAQATISERAGAIDVKITAPGADSARHFATEVSALRRSLDDAGITLRNAEVSYRSDGQQQSQDQQSGQSRQQGRADSKEVFLVKENNQ